MVKDIIEKISKGVEYLVNLEVVEKYELEEGYKYLLRCYFQSKEKTLSKFNIESGTSEIVKQIEGLGLKVC